MEVIRTYFFDTYALHEIINKNPNYEGFSKNVSIVITKLNLMEIHYIMLRDHGKEKAEEVFEFFKEFCVDFDDFDIKEANEFRLKNYRRDLSYVDCIGYIIAKKLNARFLSGDEQFKDFENVEFVK